MTNKYESISAIHRNDIGVPCSKCLVDRKTSSAWRAGGASHLVKKGTISIELFCFLPYSLHSAKTVSTFVFQPHTHTHELLPHFLGQGHDDLHNTYSHSHTRRSTGLAAFQDLVFISLDETNHRLFYTIIISDRSSAHSCPSVGTSRFPDMRKT
jgi:hypothetical protein